MLTHVGLQGMGLNATALQQTSHGPTPLQPNALPPAEQAHFLDCLDPESYRALRATCQFWKKAVDRKVNSLTQQLTPPQRAFLLAGKNPYRAIGSILHVLSSNDHLHRRIGHQQTDWAVRAVSRDSFESVANGCLIDADYYSFRGMRAHMLVSDAKGRQRWVYIANDRFSDARFTPDSRYFVTSPYRMYARDARLELWEKRPRAARLAWALPAYQKVGHLPPSLGWMHPIGIHQDANGGPRFVAQSETHVTVSDKTLTPRSAPLPENNGLRYLAYHGPSDTLSSLSSEGMLAQCKATKLANGWTYTALHSGFDQGSGWFSQNGARVVTVGRRGSTHDVRVWDLTGKQPAPKAWHSVQAEKVELLAFDTEGRHLAFSETERIDDEFVAIALVHIDIEANALWKTPVGGKIIDVTFASTQPAIYAAIVEEGGRAVSPTVSILRAGKSPDQPATQSRLPSPARFLKPVSAAQQGEQPRYGFIGFDGASRNLFMGVFQPRPRNAYRVTFDLMNPERPLWQRAVDRTAVALGMRDAF